MALGNQKHVLEQTLAAGPLAVASLTHLGCYANNGSILIPPAFGSYGTAGNNIFRGMSYFNVDLSITKVFKFGERVTAQFRAEAFNVTNTPPLGNPNGSFGTPAFGTITTALDPRVFELVVKVLF